MPVLRFTVHDAYAIDRRFQELVDLAAHSAISPFPPDFLSINKFRLSFPHAPPIRIRQLARIVLISISNVNMIQHAAVDQPDERRHNAQYQQPEYHPETAADVRSTRAFCLLTGQPVRSAEKSRTRGGNTDCSLGLLERWTACSSSRWMAVEKRFQNAGSLTPAILGVSRGGNGRCRLLVVAHALSPMDVMETGSDDMEIESGIDDKEGMVP
nr:hypothetical protein CFP56_03854 [Quercus suber]